MTGLALVTLAYYCLARRDVLPCRLARLVQDETSNLVDLTLPAKTEKKAHNGLGGYQLGELVGGSVLGPSTACNTPRLKQCNLDRGDSEGSSDYHSLNNAQHLRRPRADLGAGLGVQLEQNAMADLLIGHGSKMKVSFLIGMYDLTRNPQVNNLNIHVAGSECGVKDWGPAYCPASPSALPCPDSEESEGRGGGRTTASLPPPPPPRRRLLDRKPTGLPHSDIERSEVCQ